jgi:hypothetical protein
MSLFLFGGIEYNNGSMGKRVAWLLLCLLIVVFVCISIPSLAQENYSREEALKVFGLIEQILFEQKRSPSTGNLKNVSVTESELNSYIAYRIEVEHSDIMKELRLKLFDKNKVEGKIFIDLRGQDLPGFLRPEMNLYFNGILEIEESKVRLVLKDLFLEDQRIQPSVLDMIIYIGSKIQGEEPFSMSEWWELPYGIKDLKTEKGKAIFYY